MTQSVAVPAGSGSCSVTPVAVPGPLLETVTVKPTSSPAFTVALSAFFVTVTSGQRTVSVARLDETGVCGPLVQVSVAVLSYLPHEFRSAFHTVWLVMCTLWLSPALPLAARSPVHVRVSLGGEPAIEHVSGPLELSIDQLTP